MEKEYNPALKETLIRMGKTSAQDREYLRSQAQQAYREALKTKTQEEVLLCGETLRKLHSAVLQRVLSMAFQDIGLTGDMTFAHFEGCEELLNNSRPSARFDLPKGYYLTKVYDDIKAVKDCACGQNAEGGELNEKIRVRIMGKKEYESQRKHLLFHGAFDYDELVKFYGDGAEKKITAGSKKPGDYIVIGENKTKKLQDYFVDEKVPKDERSKAVVVKIGSDVLFVKPKDRKGRFSFNFKLCDVTKNVICIEIICDI